MFIGSNVLALMLTASFQNSFCSWPVALWFLSVLGIRWVVLLRHTHCTCSNRCSSSQPGYPLFRRSGFVVRSLLVVNPSSCRTTPAPAAAPTARQPDPPTNAPSAAPVAAAGSTVRDFLSSWLASLFGVPYIGFPGIVSNCTVLTLDRLCRLVNILSLFDGGLSFATFNFSYAFATSLP